MMAAFNVNSPAAERVSVAAPELSIAPLCQCARALFGLAVTDMVGAVGRAVGGWSDGVRCGGLRVEGVDGRGACVRVGKIWVAMIALAVE